MTKTVTRHWTRFLPEVGAFAEEFAAAQEADNARVNDLDAKIRALRQAMHARERAARERAKEAWSDAEIRSARDQLIESAVKFGNHPFEPNERRGLKGDHPSCFSRWYSVYGLLNVKEG